MNNVSLFNAFLFFTFLKVNREIIWRELVIDLVARFYQMFDLLG